jgi:spore germination protein KB
MIIISSTLILTAAYTVRNGIESVARSAFICTIIFIFPATFMLFLIPDLDLRNMLPVMEHGIMPSFRGALIPQSWFGEFFLISFLLPYLSDDKNGMKWSLLSVLFVMVGLTFCNLLILSLFGHNISTMQYPVLTAFRYISVAGFLDNFESVVMAIWVLGNFVKISLFYYAVSLSLSQWLNLSDMRPVVIGLGILMIMFSFWSLPSLQDVTTYLTGAFVIFGTLMQTIVPALLLAIGYVRRNKVT